MAGLFDRLQEDLDQREKMAGMSPADLLELPDDERKVVQTLARRGDLTLEELVEAIGLPEEEIAGSLERLHQRGFARGLEIKGRVVYRTYFGRRRASGMAGSLWAQLAEKTDPKDDEEDGVDTEPDGEEAEDDG